MGGRQEERGGEAWYREEMAGGRGSRVEKGKGRGPKLSGGGAGPRGKLRQHVMGGN